MGGFLSDSWYKKQNLTFHLGDNSLTLDLQKIHWDGELLSFSDLNFPLFGIHISY